MRVAREFYVNDAATSTQMVRFGESLVVRYLQEFGQRIEFPGRWLSRRICERIRAAHQGARGR